MTTAVTSTALSDLAALGQLMKQDLLQDVGAPVLTLLQTLQTIAGTPVGPGTIVQAQGAWVIFVGNLLLAAPKLGADEQKAVIGFLITKVQALAA
jgi:hypothetical protein